MKHNIFSVFFVFFLTFPLFGVAQKHLHNGFVAATSTGVWYLQDGFNEWINIKDKDSDDNTVKVKSISHSYKKLKSLLIDESVYSSIYNIYGKGLSESVYNMGAISELSEPYYCGLVTKFKHEDCFFGIYVDYDANYIRYQNLNLGQTNYFTKFDAILVSETEITSIASDEDSTVIIVGTNNKMYKYAVCDGIPNHTHVTGLVSSASSGHQICYDSNNDLFYIVSDEGIIYSYNKTIVDSITTVTGGIMDSCTSVCYDDSISALFIGYATYDSENDYGIMRYNSNWELSSIVGGFYPADPIQLCTNNKGKVGTFNSNYFITIENDIIVENDDLLLPSGTVVYDLDYIDYLP